MTSLVNEEPIILAPNPYAVAPIPDTVETRAGIFNQLTVTGNLDISPPATFNGSTVSGALVTAGGTVTLTNKSLVDNSTWIINNADATKKVMFNVNVGTGTTSTIQFNAAETTTYTFPDIGVPSTLILGTTPDSTAAGGNARGTDAVDLQITRTAAAEVASGPNSTIGGGANNTASAQYATVPGGNTNTASGISSFAAGDTSTAAANYSAALGRQASAQHQGAIVLADSQNAAQASTTTDQLTARFQGGFRTLGGPFAFNDLWYILSVPITTTSNATATTIFTGALPTGDFIYYIAFIVSSNAANVCAHRLSAVFKNIGGTVSLSTQFDGWDSGDTALTGTTLSWTVVGNNPTLQATGLAATNLDWKGAVQYTLNGL